MCGISAVIALDDTKLSTYQVQTSDYRSKISSDLDKSLEYIKHRGPDAQGKWISDDNRVAFGHVRLAINDLSSDGEQPFTNPERTVFAVVNGEFYAHETIKANLPEPYHFKGNSDCEIVIALYLQYGMFFLSKLRGEFAICLYDSRSQMFIAARDRYGIKPLYWSIQDGRLLVASEMKAFLPFGWEPEWDVNSLVEAGWVHDSRMIFKNVNKVRPGNYIVCKGFSNLEQRQYWDLDFPNKHIVDVRSEQDIIQGLQDRLFESVRLRLKADVPVGVYLSGGIDSSAVAGMMAHLLEEEGKLVGLDSKIAKSKLLAFTVEFEGAEFNEAPLAQKTADFLGIRLERVLMNEEIYARLFEEAYWHSEHHMGDLNVVGKYALSELARSHEFKVVMTGEGSNEHFGGYTHFFPDFLREADDTWPASKGENAARLAMLEHAEKNFQPVLKGIKLAKQQKSMFVRRMLNNTAIADLLTFVPRGDFASWTEGLQTTAVQETIANTLDGRILELMNTRWHPLHTAEYVFANGAFPSILLACMGDKTEMAHSIEGRPPFLDHVVTEYANNIPPSLKIKRDQETGEFTEKWILREAMKPYILEELYKRKKHPFTAPISFSENGPLRKLLDKLITEENIENLGFVDWDKSKGLTAAAFGAKNDQLAMWKAFVVAQWVSLGQRFGVKKAVPPKDL